MIRSYLCTAYVAVAALVVPLVLDSAPALAQMDTLRGSTVSMPPGRGNPLTGFGTPGTYTWSGMFDTLTVIDETGDASPALAASWRNIAPTTPRDTATPDFANFTRGGKASCRR